MARLRDRLPTGGRLSDEDWAGRHRLLTVLLAVCMVLLTVFGVLRDAEAGDLLITDGMVLTSLVVATLPRNRRVRSLAVALGYVAASGGFVAICQGLTEAHFAFFILIPALALYRDWAPFGGFLVGTTLHHAGFGVVQADHTFGHDAARQHPMVWALLHGAAVLAAASFQLLAWRFNEIEELRAEEHLSESQAQLSVAFDETPVPMAMFAPNGRLLRTNVAYRDWLRLPAGLPEGFSMADLPLSPINPGEQPITRMLTETREPITVTRQYRRTDDDSLMWVQTHATGLYDRDGSLRLTFVHCLDVTAVRDHEAELRYQVRHDSLTGLLSRKAFEHDLTELLAASPEPVSVIYLDVDRFKSINDGAGHTTGDDVLRALANRLAEVVPTGSLLARLGGDEFIAALAGPSGTGLRVGNGILAALAGPLAVGGYELPVSCSIGVTTAVGAIPADDVVLAADTAMYAAKRAGGNRLQVFTDELRVPVQEKIAAEARVRRALAGDPRLTLPLWFQPVVSTVNGQIAGAEALVRMRTPDGEILSPYHFVGAAEETGLIVPLGEHVLRSAVEHLLHWQDRLGYVSVNVSPRQLAEPDFVPMVAGVLNRVPWLDPSRIVLEITETALLSSAVDVGERLASLKQLGVRIALDDFGTGYSSLTWLKSLPADIVKLDRSFVAGLAEDPRKASIIQAVLWLARSLTMSTIAEGVEELADWEALRAAGCPAVQGYLFSKPLPAAEFDVMLRESFERATFEGVHLRETMGTSMAG
ncbi:putative bifunctional diguanylate cyclase/phosphodiesterase [Actinoplanes subglobosus]|uniref:Bifunctional diguanylate cyclase/phosphodiesterase n=1 Tax=Actinoplanes subglobosus TaxID=1547892 RepID=A0ABV8J304_9ACTN